MVNDNDSFSYTHKYKKTAGFILFMDSLCRATFVDNYYQNNFIISYSVITLRIIDLEHKRAYCDIFKLFNG